jgi:hypothetical protein
MTRTQIKRELRANKKAGVRPWSMYQLAQMRGCSRSFVTTVMQGKVKSAPFCAWCDQVFAGSAHARAAVAEAVQAWWEGPP